MLFGSSRYDFRFRRYHRAKKRVIFNRLTSSSLSDLSHSSLTDLYQTEATSDSWKKTQLKERSIPRKNIGQWICDLFKFCGNFECVYLGDRSRYRDESKSDGFLNGFLLFPDRVLTTKISTFSLCFF